MSEEVPRPAPEHTTGVGSVPGARDGGVPGAQGRRTALLYARQEAYLQWLRLAQQRRDLAHQMRAVQAEIEVYTDDLRRLEDECSS